MIDCYPDQVSLQKNISTTTTTEQSNSCSSSDIVWEEKFSTFADGKKTKTISIKIEQTKVSDSGLILSNQMERDGDFDQEGLELTCLDLFKVLLYSH